MIRGLLILLAVVSLFCGYLWLRVDSLVVVNKNQAGDIAQYKLVATDNVNAIIRLKAAAIKTDHLLATQYDVNKSLHKQLQHNQRELIKLGDKDEQVKAWADKPVPDAITRLLNQTNSVDQD